MIIYVTKCTKYIVQQKKIPTKEKINVQKISWILEMNCSCSIM